MLIPKANFKFCLELPFFSMWGWVSDFKGVLYKISSPSQPVKYVCTTGLI